MLNEQIEALERRVEALRRIEEARQEMAAKWAKVRTALGLHLTEVRFLFDGDRLVYVGLKSRETDLPVSGCVVPEAGDSEEGGELAVVTLAKG